MDVILFVVIMASLCLVAFVLGFATQWADRRRQERREQKQIADWSDRQPPIG